MSRKGNFPTVITVWENFSHCEAVWKILKVVSAGNNTYIPHKCLAMALWTSQQIIIKVPPPLYLSEI